MSHGYQQQNMVRPYAVNTNVAITAFSFQRKSYSTSKFVYHLYISSIVTCRLSTYIFQSMENYSTKDVFQPSAVH
jgi:hypothetical protein